MGNAFRADLGRYLSGRIGDNMIENETEYVRLWNCLICKNVLQISGQMNVKWEQTTNHCCLEALVVMRSRILDCDAGQNQVNKISTLFNKFVLGKMVEDISTSLESEIHSQLLDSSYIQLDNSREVERIDRHIRPEMQSAWSEGIRLTPERPECPRCCGNMRPRGDSLICRKCNYEKF